MSYPCVQCGAPMYALELDEMRAHFATHAGGDRRVEIRERGSDLGIGFAAGNNTTREDEPMLKYEEALEPSRAAPQAGSVEDRVAAIEATIAIVLQLHDQLADSTRAELKRHWHLISELREPPTSSSFVIPAVEIMAVCPDGDACADAELHEAPRRSLPGVVVSWPTDA